MCIETCPCCGFEATLKALVTDETKITHTTMKKGTKGKKMRKKNKKRNETKTRGGDN